MKKQRLKYKMPDISCLGVMTIDRRKIREVAAGIRKYVESHVTSDAKNYLLMECNRGYYSIPLYGSSRNWGVIWLEEMKCNQVTPQEISNTIDTWIELNGHAKFQEAGICFFHGQKDRDTFTIWIKFKFKKKNELKYQAKHRETADLFKELFGGSIN